MNNTQKTILTLTLLILLLCFNIGSVCAVEGLIPIYLEYDVQPFVGEFVPIDDGKVINKIDGIEYLIVWKSVLIMRLGTLISGTIFHDILVQVSPYIFTIFSFLVFFRFASIKKRTPSAVPAKILDYLKEHSGSSQKQIIEAVGASRGSVSYHLKNLERDYQIKSIQENGVTQYFLTSHVPDSVEHTAVLRFLSRKKSGDALRYLWKSKETTKQKLAHHLQIRESSARWYLEQFKEYGLVITSMKNGTLQYIITEKAETILKKEID